MPDSNPANIDASEKLFNPQHNSGDRGLCAALCYLVTAFIRHRKMGLLLGMLWKP